MSKSKLLQPQGGKLSDGSPNKSKNPKRNAGHALSQETIDAIARLPQIESGEWSKSYLAEQLWRNYLGLKADFDWWDLDLIAKRAIVE